MTAVLPARGARVAPQRRPAGRHLKPVERPAPRRSAAVPALVGVAMVIGALLALAVMHALLIGGQVRLDGMHRDIAAETESIRRLELRVAELESPDRVLDVARERLGMVQPAEVGYLLPVGVEGGPDVPVRVAVAEAPEPEPLDVATATSAEQAEVEQALADDHAAPPGPVEGGRDG
jgi:cell division protein FtsB